ncbi:4-hydroxythreonine-4-phosphate dehydrogenase [hydrothermal vent metagenome]|uniref:4-hydroxythreonine-4-phosphate dehydrogenase n=1 Tax=hydrothermal vent metagenome TaxID=652676 RepID=A0A1W1E7I9_9ZZZZ
MQKKKIAVSIGDLNGIGIQLALQNHSKITAMVDPLYCIDRDMLQQAADLLQISVPDDFQTIDPDASAFEIEPGKVSAPSGAYAYASFVKAVELARAGKVDAITTLPIHKKAWEEAGVPYKGHTDALRDFFDADAIMMLGCPKMYVALFTEHIPLKEVADAINEEDLTRFLVNFYNTAKPTSTVAVLGLNPHAGDDGVLGDEEKIIQKAIDNATAILKKENPSLFTLHSSLFTTPMVPDVAFTPNVRKHYTYYIAMYHDQGLAPLKALYFDEGINVSLNLPILRTSVDHGTAFDIAYKGVKLNTLSYLNAVKYVAGSSF